MRWNHQGLLNNRIIALSASIIWEFHFIGKHYVPSFSARQHSSQTVNGYLLEIENPHLNMDWQGCMV